MKNISKVPWNFQDISMCVSSLKDGKRHVHTNTVTATVWSIIMISLWFASSVHFINPRFKPLGV